MPQLAAGLVPAFSFPPEQLGVRGKHRTLFLAPDEVKWSEEKRGKKICFFVNKSNNASRGKWGQTGQHGEQDILKTQHGSLWFLRLENRCLN